jgi:shikimate kinase
MIVSPGYRDVRPLWLLAHRPFVEDLQETPCPSRNIIRSDMSTAAEVRLVGPGGAGKSTTGTLLAERLQVTFVDLDRHLTARVGDIGEFIGRHGYDVYARENIETYCSLFRGTSRPGVVALSSGFMTYARDSHPEYLRVLRELEQHHGTFVLLPSMHRDVCVAETVRRQITRPFARSSAKEEAVIQARYDIYAAMPMRKIETMRPVAAVVDEIVAALAVPRLQLSPVCSR